MLMATANSLFITLPIGWYLATQTDMGPTVGDGAGGQGDAKGVATHETG